MIIPTAQLSRESVKFTYSGVRPLPYAEGKKPSSITRSHVLYDHTSEGASNLTSLIGGKITTYRQVGEEVVDTVFRRRQQPAPQSPTRKRPLPGAIHAQDQAIASALAQYHDLVAPDSIHHLFAIYGQRAIELLSLIDDSPELAEPITPQHPAIRAQIVYAVKSEYAEMITDIVHRRTMLAMYTNYGFDILPVLRETLKQYCGWSDDRTAKAIAQFQTFMRENCIPDYALAAYGSSNQSSDPTAMATAS